MEGPTNFERTARRKPIKGGKARARIREFEAERRAFGAVGSSWLAAFAAKEELAAAAPAVAIPQIWKSIGPYAIPHGQTFGQGPGSHPSVAGRVSAIAVDPGNPAHILIGAAGGGVWESKDAGATWFPRTDRQRSLFIGAVCFDPSSPSIAWAGTGEGDAMWRLGVGALRSTDGGTSWNLLGLDKFEQVGFFDIAVDPLDSSHILGATTNGLWDSPDNGQTWNQTRTGYVWNISISAAAGKSEILIASELGVFSSTTSGASWNGVQLPGFQGPAVRIEACHAHPSGDRAYVFAAGANPQPGTDDQPANPIPYLWRRETAGGAFAAIPMPYDLQTKQAGYDWCAATAPGDPDTLYLGAIDLHQGIRSAAGDWNWFNISTKPAGDSIHRDQHAIAFSPADPKVVYIGCDGGIFRSPDAGLHFRSLNKGLCISEIEYLAQHPDFEAWLLAGTQDNGTLRYEGAEVWYQSEVGDGGDCGANAHFPYTCYHSYYGMGLDRSDTGGGGGSWNYIGPRVTPDKDQPNGSLFYPPMAVNGPVVAQAGISLYVSRNSGKDWNEILLPQRAAATMATVLAIPAENTVYAGTTQGSILRIDFVDGVWQSPVALTQPALGYVSDFIVDPTNVNRLWATYGSLPDCATNSRVFRSDDAGANWQDVGGALPTIYVNAIQVDPANPDTVYVALDVGVWRSTDAGATWTSLNKGLPNALVKDLVFHARTRLLRAATQSRGVWEMAVDEAGVPDVEIYIRDSSVDTGRAHPSPSGVDDPFNFGQQTFWWNCADMKVDAPPYQRPAVNDIDFDAFEDDHGLFAAGLFDTNPQRRQPALVYVQIHNRGAKPAVNVAAKVFFADTSQGWPHLPDGFWTNFPSNTLPPDSKWQAVAAHRVVPILEPARSCVVAFEWPVPWQASGNTSLLAVITADNDPISTNELAIDTLVPNSSKCGLKRVAVAT